MKLECLKSNFRWKSFWQKDLIDQWVTYVMFEKAFKVVIDSNMVKKRKIHDEVFWERKNLLDFCKKNS